MLTKTEKLQVFLVSAIILFVILTISYPVYSAEKKYEPEHTEEYDKGWDDSMKEVLNICRKFPITQTVIINDRTGEAWIFTCKVKPFVVQVVPKKLL